MLIVQKYGGTSVGALERIDAVAERVIKNAKEGYQLVAIVSVMSGVTNTLIEQAEYFSKNPNGKDMDMLLNSGECVMSTLLSIALNERGYPSLAFSGRKAGIITDGVSAKARVPHIDTQAITKALSEGEMVVIAGSQGVDKEGDVTALGRGGSDLSAVAVAGAPKADLCEIYTDMDGVYTTDPRIESKAKRLDKISYEKMLELASLGAKVLQNRSVELAKKLNVKLVTRSSFNDNEGTMITREDGVEQALVSGIALDRNQARATLRGIEDKLGIIAETSSVLADENINVDMIIQNVGVDGATNLGFTMPQNELDLAKNAIQKISGSKTTIESNSAVVRVSIVGVGMKSYLGVASKALKALVDEGINIGMTSTSETKISMIVHERYGELAVRALHKCYGLDK